MRYDDEIVQANIERLKEHPQGRNWCVGGNIHYAELIMASLLDERTKLESQRDTLLPQAKAAHSAGHALGLPGGTDITVELVPAVEALMASHGQALAALVKYEEAFDLLFGQCCSNGIFDAWGKRVDCTTLNEAHELAGKAIKQSAAPADGGGV